MKPVKVVLLSTNFTYTGNVVFELAKVLARNNTIVEMVVPHQPGFPKKEKVNGVIIHRFQYFFPGSLQQLAYGSGMFENFQGGFWRTLQIPFFLLAFVLKTLQVTRQCDVIHAHWTVSGIPGILAKKMWRKPLILTAHGNGWRQLPRSINLFLLRNSDALTTSHPDLADEIRAALPGKEVLEIRNMLNYAQFNEKRSGARIREEFGIGGEKVVSYIAKMVEWKDPLTFTRAVPMVLGRYPDTRFFMVGFGQLEEAVKENLKELGITKQVIVTGRREDVPDFLAASDVFCAISNLENIFSTILIEALYMRVPCILTTAGYTEKYFQHRENALLIPSGDAEALADAIIALLEDNALRDKIAARGKGLIAETGFVEQRILEQNLAVYHKVRGEKA